MNASSRTTLKHDIRILMLICFQYKVYLNITIKVEVTVDQLTNEARSERFFPKDVGRSLFFI